MNQRKGDADMEKRTNSFNMIAVIILAATCIGNLAAYFFLPDMLVMQITAGGEAGTTMPTAIGLIVETAITGFLAWRVFSAPQENKAKLIFAMCILLAANIFILIYNL